MLAEIICRVRGHQFKDSRQYLLPARRCCRCGQRQVLLPRGEWVDEIDDRRAKRNAKHKGE